MTLQFDKGWVIRNDTINRLESQGYSVAGYTNKEQQYYVLYKIHLHTEIVYETNDPDELNRYVKLLIGSGDESTNKDI